MKEKTPIKDNEFNKFFMNMKNMDNEDQALVLLCSPSLSYKYCITIVLYGKDTISLEDIKSYLLEEFREMVFVRNSDNQVGGLMVRRRNFEKGLSNINISQSRQSPKQEA